MGKNSSVVSGGSDGKCNHSRTKSGKESFEKINTVVQTETAASISQAVKLFIAPEIKVKGGSKLVVEQNGVTTEYSASGEPAIYLNHQEIILELFKGWA